MARAARDAARPARVPPMQRPKPGSAGPGRAAIISWLLGDPLRAAALVGLVMYGLLRLAYALFYERLGVTPEEVGLGYSQVLAQSAVGVLLLYAVGLVVVSIAGSELFLYPLALLLTLRDLLPVLLSRIRDFVVRPREGRVRLSDRAVAAIAVSTLFQTELEVLSKERRRRLVRTRRFQLAVVGVSLVSVAAVLVIMAEVSTRRLSRGEAVKPVRLLGVPLLSLRAEPVNLVWLATPPAALQSKRCLLFLGQANNTVVLYHAPSKRIVRLPMARVATQVGGQVPRGCE